MIFTSFLYVREYNKPLRYYNDIRVLFLYDCLSLPIISSLFHVKIYNRPVDAYHDIHALFLCKCLSFNLWIPTSLKFMFHRRAIEEDTMLHYDWQGPKPDHLAC